MKTSLMLVKVKFVLMSLQFIPNFFLKLGVLQHYLDLVLGDLPSYICYNQTMLLHLRYSHTFSLSCNLLDHNQFIFYTRHTSNVPLKHPNNFLNTLSSTLKCFSKYNITRKPHSTQYNMVQNILRRKKASYLNYFTMKNVTTRGNTTRECNQMAINLLYQYKQDKGKVFVLPPQLFKKPMNLSWAYLMQIPFFHRKIRTMKPCLKSSCASYLNVSKPTFQLS